MRLVVVFPLSLFAFRSRGGTLRALASACKRCCETGLRNDESRAVSCEKVIGALNPTFCGMIYVDEEPAANSPPI